MESWREDMRDAAYAGNVATWPGARGGYLEAGDPFNAWTVDEWLIMTGIKKLPILAMSDPSSEAEAERIAAEVLGQLANLKVPQGAFTALDLEEAVNPEWVTRYGLILNEAGYKVWPYGSLDTIFRNPQLNGYWVAAPTSEGQPYMYERAGSLIRATQYAENVNDQYDSSTVKPWTLTNGKWWV